MRLAFRQLHRAPGFALAAILTLALGIGANTAIFSVVDAVMLRPPPYAGPERVVALWEVVSEGLSAPGVAPETAPAQRVAVVRQTTLLVAAGVVVGLAGALAASRLVTSLLFEIAPTDPLTYAVTAAALLVAGAVAGALAGRRATRVDPITALR